MLVTSHLRLSLLLANTLHARTAPHRSWPTVVRAACEFAREQQLVLHTNLSPKERAGKWWAVKPLQPRTVAKRGRLPPPLPPGEPHPHPHAECLRMNVSRAAWNT